MTIRKFIRIGRSRLRRGADALRVSVPAQDRPAPVDHRHANLPQTFEGIGALDDPAGLKTQDFRGLRRPPTGARSVGRLARASDDDLGHRRNGQSGRAFSWSSP